MLNNILNNLKEFPEDDCYEIKGIIYKNKELYKYICNIYHYLLQNNKNRKSVIVYGHKDIYMIASFLACSFAGITYVPIDISIPVERKEKIIEQINPDIILDKNIEDVMINESHKDISKIYMQDEDIYYIIFTSGSTGEPKGVQITYNNLKSCMKWLESICNINKGIILNQANYSFDLSVADLYLPLLTRSKHYILERNIQRDYSLLFKELKNSNSNLAVFTPSFLDLLLVDKSFNEELMPNLQTVLLCGEKLTEETVDKLFERFSNLNLINSYGPTECTFAVTSIKINNSKDISIGIPKDDVKLYIVNDNLEELNEGEIGEILITGASVGKGYLNNSKNKNFIIYNEHRGYLTGDLGYKKDNKFYCIGRKDTQIKYKGYRIELSEIETVLNNIEYTEKAIVTTNKTKDDKVSRIIAFVKVKASFNITQKDIKEQLKKALPEYMIPNIKLINEIPLTPNGKINTKKLLEDCKNERANS